MIRPRFIAMFVLCLALSVACQGKSSPEPFSISTATPSLQSSNATPAWATPVPEEYILSAMPHCQGLIDLRVRLIFDWPNIEQALEKLADYNWGYYTCDLAQPALQIFMHDNMPKPPYLWREVNHANHNGGQVTLYYQPFSVVFMYIWMLPKPDTQISYMVIARGDPGVPQTWECRQRFPLFSLAAVSRTSMRNWLQ